MMEIDTADSHIPPPLRRRDVRNMNHDRSSIESMGGGRPKTCTDTDQRVITKGTGPLPPWPTRGDYSPDRRSLPLTKPSTLSRGTRPFPSGWFGWNVRPKRLMRPLGGSVRLKRPMRPLGGSVCLKRPMRPLGGSCALSALCAMGPISSLLHAGSAKLQQIADNKQQGPVPRQERPPV